MEKPQSWVINAQSVSRHLTGDHGALTILDKASLSVAAGETISIVGASGSGKSTLLGLLAGLDVPDSGEISLLSKPISQMDEDARAGVRAGEVGFVFQSFMLLPEMTALENVSLAAELTGEEAADQRAAEWLNRVGLAERHYHFPGQLSGGEQQRVAIARAFVTRPKIVFADEPTGNLDSETGHAIIDLLFNTHTEVGTTLVLVTHDPELAERCQRIYRMQAGQLEAER